VQGPLLQRHDPARLPLPDPGPVPPLPPHPRAQRHLVLRLQLRLLGERGAARRKQPGSLAGSGTRFLVKKYEYLFGRPHINGLYRIAATAVRCSEEESSLLSGEAQRT
jgi:hypothetical protein